MSSSSHPLVRMGTSQDERMTGALVRESVELDDRSLPQLLMWMRGYARQLVYYASSGKPAGSWLPLMRDECMLVAQILCFDLGSLERRQADLETKVIEAKGEVTKLEDVIVAVMHDIAARIDQVRGWRAMALEGLATWRALDLAYRGELARIATVLHEIVTAWNKRQDPEKTVSIVFDDEIVHAVKTSTVTLVDIADVLDLHRRVLGEFRRLVRLAPKLLDDALAHPGHRPDQGLLLAFLQLYVNHAQPVLNGIARRHLDFYYQRALGLRARPSVPDRAYVVLGLAKHVDQHRLATGTRFWAKDPSGPKLQFALEQEFVPNRARVAQLAGLYVERGEKRIELFASPRVDSGDGEGQPFTTQPSSWHPFGRNEPARAVEVGLAIATPVLWMAEGPRSVELQLRVQLTQAGALDTLVAKSTAAQRRDVLASALAAAKRAIDILRDLGLFTPVLRTSPLGPLLSALMRRVTARVKAERDVHEVIRSLGSELAVRSPSTDAIEAAKLLANASLSTPGTPQLLLEEMVRTLHELPRAGWLGEGLSELEQRVSELEPPAPKPKLANPFAKDEHESKERAVSESEAQLLLERAKTAVDKLSALSEPDMTTTRSPRDLSGEPTLEAILYDLKKTLEAAKQAFAVAEREEARNRPLPWADLLEASDEWLENLRWLQSLELMSANAWTTGREQRKIVRLQAAGEQLFLLPWLTQLIGIGLQKTRLAIEAELPKLDLPTLCWGLTGAKGWLTENAELRANGSNRRYDLTITIGIGEEKQAIVGYAKKLHGGDYATDAPLLTLRFGPEVHGLLADATLEKVTVLVTCGKVHNLVLHTPNGPAKPDKPVACFGTAPRLGSAFLIGSWEVFSKRLEHIKLNLEWVDDLSTIFGRSQQDVRDNAARVADVGPTRLSEEKADQLIRDIPTQLLRGRADKSGESPNDVTKLEAGSKTPKTPKPIYQSPYDAVTEDQFRARASLLHDGIFHELGKPDDVTIREPLTFKGLSGYAATPSLPRFDRYTVGQPAGFLRLALNTPLQHADYPRLMAEAVRDKTAQAPIPSPPWTPVLAAGLSLEYTASVDADTSALPKDLQLFHLLPFGHRQLQSSTTTRLLPALDAHAPVTGKKGSLVGALYIGIADLQPRQSLSLLVQAAHAKPDSARPHIYWSYLDGDEWHDLPPTSLLADGSNGLLGTGIVRVDIPEQDTRHHAMPTDLRWLRAAVTDNPDGVAQLIDIRAQAAAVVFVDDGRHSARLASPLPAGSIRKLVESDAAIKTIEQPFSSWGGMVAEQLSSPTAGTRDLRYDRRVHERLRHKGRAITAWDYERLVLEHFPEVFRVKCLPHTSAKGPRAPGSIKLVVVANLENVNAPDRLRPCVGQETRARIREFLLERASPHLRSSPESLSVCDPKFTTVKVTTTVEFEPGRDVGYWSGQLQRDLDRFLAPWAYEPVARRDELRFGGRVPASAFVDFMHELDYVRTVHQLCLNVGSSSSDVAEADSLDAILVPPSPPDSSHEILLPKEGGV
jgi:hypothetical protein